MNKENGFPRKKAMLVICLEHLHSQDRLSGTAKFKGLVKLAIKLKQLEILILVEK